VFVTVKSRVYTDTTGAYPDLAELIRQKTNKESREKLVQREKALQGADLLIKELRDALSERDADLKKIAVVNLRLSMEKKALQEQNALLFKENEQLEGINREMLSKINSPRGLVQSIR
jgi:hypothetical protein